MLWRQQRRGRLQVLRVLVLLLVALAALPARSFAEEAMPDAVTSETTEMLAGQADGVLDQSGAQAEDAADSEANPLDDDSLVMLDQTLLDELQLTAQDDGSGAVTVKNLRLYDLDGTEQTLSGDYDCMKRFIIVGRYGCSNTRNVVNQALAAAEEAEFADISFLVLDVDGNKSTFQEGFGSWETDRVRFFSSDSSAYDAWVWWAYRAMGNESCSGALPFTVLIDRSNHIQAVLTGVQSVRELCRTYLDSNDSNPDDVDPGDPDQFEPEMPEDPSAYDELSFSVWGKADMQSGRELLPLVNEARAAVGVSALTWDSELEQTAYQRGAEQMVLYSHTRPNGYDCFSAWPVSQLNYAGENIAMGQTTVVQVNDSWTNSPGHYANMINADFTTFAAAHFKSEDGRDFWVECFGGGVGSGMTDAQAMGKVNVGVNAIKGNVRLSLQVTPGVYNEGLGEFDRSIPKLKINQKQQLVLVAWHADVDASDVIWTSSNPSVVHVDETGKMVGDRKSVV